MADKRSSLFQNQRQMPQQEAPVTNEPTQLAPAPQTQPPSVGLVAQFRSISEVLATFPSE
jgi:hypothetical protein